MVPKIRPAATIYSLFEKDDRATCHKLGLLYEALSNLRHEGKMHLGKNVIGIKALVVYFKKELNSHMKEEERSLFPFLCAHIPRLEPMVYLLLSEHEDLRKCLEILDKTLNEIHGTAGPRLGRIDKIYEQGTYLICLLRSHMRVESTSLYKAADEELRPAEKKELIRQIKRHGARVCDPSHRHHAISGVG